MPDRSQLEALFVAHLADIDDMLGFYARRHGLFGAEAEDLASWAKLRLVESDYHALACFRGGSSLETYLGVVLARLARDYCVQERGRWRPSAAALHAGPLAVQLERLVNRDGYALHEAAEVLRASGEDPPSMRALGELLARLPRRGPPRPRRVDGAALDAAPADGAADDEVRVGEDAADQAAADRALARALARLPDEDRVMVRMRFWEGSSVADVARVLGVPQKPLYRRLERALVLLRAALESEGLGREAARAYLAAGVRSGPGTASDLTSEAVP